MIASSATSWPEMLAIYGLPPDIIAIVMAFSTRQGQWFVCAMVYPTHLQWAPASYKATCWVHTCLWSSWTMWWEMHDWLHSLSYCILPHGSSWSLEIRFTDVAYADDVVLLNPSMEGLDTVQQAGSMGHYCMLVYQCSENKACACWKLCSLIGKIVHRW